MDVHTVCEARGEREPNPRLSCSSAAPLRRPARCTVSLNMAANRVRAL